MKYYLWSLNLKLTIDLALHCPQRFSNLGYFLKFCFIVLLYKCSFSNFPYTYQWLCHYICNSGFSMGLYSQGGGELGEEQPELRDMEAVSLGSWTLLHARVHARVQHSTRYFPADGSTNPDVFQPKTLCIRRGIIPQNFSS